MIGMKQKRSRPVAALLLATILALAAPAAAKSWRISNFQDTITVNNDGSALVNETISLVFVGEWHGIHRTIPIEYPGPDGTNYQLFVDIKSITDENGAKLKYDSSTSGAARDLKIYIPDAVYGLLQGREGLEWIFRDYDNLREAEEDFYTAWRKALARGWTGEV